MTSTFSSLSFVGKRLKWMLYIRVVHNFEVSERWLMGTNKSFMSLIPKVDNPQHLNEFRPISLVEC